MPDIGYLHGFDLDIVILAIVAIRRAID